MTEMRKFYNTKFPDLWYINEQATPAHSPTSSYSQKMKGVMTIHFSSSGSQLSSRAVRNSQPCSLNIALDLNDEQVDITSYNYGNLEDWL